MPSHSLRAGRPGLYWTQAWDLTTSFLPNSQLYAKTERGSVRSVRIRCDHSTETRLIKTT
jgi:hypothetical protein